MFPGPLNWDGAQAQCISQGANLASIHNQEEYDFVLGNPMQLYTNWLLSVMLILNWERKCLFSGLTTARVFWLGGSDSQVEDDWAWADQVSPWAFSPWDTANGQPNDNGVQDCLVSLNSLWHDSRCPELLPFLCRKDL